MPIATQSMTKAPSNLTPDAQQNSIINLSQKTGGMVSGLIENSYNTNESQALHQQQQQQLQNPIESNPNLEKTQIYQQTHENVSSVLPVITTNPNTNPITTSNSTITQQSFDSLSLNVANVNTNLSSNLNQISPKDNQTTSQTNNTTTTTIITSNNNNNNNTTNNNNNVIQNSPSNVNTIAGLTSIQSNTTLTTSMTTISSLDHSGAGTSSQMPSTNGTESINDIVDNLNVDHKSSRYLIVHFS